MAPKRSTKQSSGLAQPTLAFQTRLKGASSAKGLAKNAGKPPSVRRSDSAASLASVEREATPQRDSVDLSHVPDDERLILDPNSKQWNVLYKNAKAEMGNLPPIHAAQANKVQNILRVFDMTSKYGPCVGITRLERWERAKKWGLNPPEEIKTILTTQQGEDEAAYRESVLYGWV